MIECRRAEGVCERFLAAPQPVDEDTPFGPRAPLANGDLQLDAADGDGDPGQEMSTPDSWLGGSSTNSPSRRSRLAFMASPTSSTCSMLAFQMPM